MGKFTKHIIISILAWLLAVNLIVIVSVVPANEGTEADRNLFRMGHKEHMINVYRHLDIEKYKDEIKGFYQNLFKDDGALLGRDKAYLEPVEKLIWRNVKFSTLLIIPALMLSLILGVIKGIYDFKKKRKRWSIFGGGTTNFFLAVPDFMIVLLVQVLLLKIITMGFPHISLYGEGKLSTAVLGISFLMIYPTMYLAKHVSNFLAEEQSNEYILTAKSKGTSELKIIGKHMLLNTIPKILGHIPTMMLYIISSLFIVEHLMMFRGATVRLFEHLEKDNSPMIFGIVLYFATLMLVIDLACHILRHLYLRRVS